MRKLTIFVLSVLALLAIAIPATAWFGGFGWGFPFWRGLGCGFGCGFPWWGGFGGLGCGLGFGGCGWW